MTMFPNWMHRVVLFHPTRTWDVATAETAALTSPCEFPDRDTAIHQQMTKWPSTHRSEVSNVGRRGYRPGILDIHTC